MEGMPWEGEEDAWQNVKNSSESYIEHGSTTLQLRHNTLQRKYDINIIHIMSTVKL
jgi:hypothetical protein